MVFKHQTKDKEIEGLEPAYYFSVFSEIIEEGFSSAFWRHQFVLASLLLKEHNNVKNLGYI